MTNHRHGDQSGGVMSTRARRKVKKTKRQACGYTEDRPDMCNNCENYVRPMRPFPARCSRHEFEVRPQAFCNDYAPRDQIKEPS